MISKYFLLNNIFLILLLPLFFYLQLNQVRGQEDGDGKMMHTCKGVEIDLAEEHAMGIEECLRTYNATSLKDIPPENMACIGKCAMEKTGLVDEAGHPHKENIFNFIKDALPKEVHDDLGQKMEKCLDEETEDIDPADESCVSYLPLCMCIHLAFLEECH